MVYTEPNQAYTEANRNVSKGIATAKEKLERALKELKDTRAPKELKDPKVAHGTTVQEAGEHTQTDPQKAEATGTTATETTTVEEERLRKRWMEEVPATHKNDTNNKRVHLLTYQRKRWSAKSANGQGNHGMWSPTIPGTNATTQEATWKATVATTASMLNDSEMHSIMKTKNASDNHHLGSVGQNQK
jgi:hypothetical protein